VFIFEMRFDKQIVLVTGGSNGIGAAIVKRFVDEGARVIVFDIKKPAQEVEFFKVDICDEEQIKQAVEQIDKIDVLVNNAGIYFQEPIVNTSKESLDRIIDVNVKGPYLMCKHCIPKILLSKGNIVNIASGLGVVPESSSPAYCSSKAAVIMLTKCLAQEYAREGIRVNSVLPGPIDTPLLRKSFENDADKVVCENKNPMRRIGKPREVANIVVFLASEEASYVTGGMYAVDGGESTSSVYSK
jgi:NAD(P)-dependent dehydrogenase (short-subunit alcohol dehydrogenase family)